MPDDQKVTETVKPSYTPVQTTQEPVSTSDQSTPNQPRDWSNIIDSKAADITTEVNKTTSVPDLEALYELEEKGQNRSGVLKSIEKRVAQLEGENT